MKKMALVALLPTLVLGIGLTCCNKKANTDNVPVYEEERLYNEEPYEPIDLSYNDYDIINIELLGATKGIKAVSWDETDLKLRCTYRDDNHTIRDFPIKVKNIPVENRHYLGEVGEHHLHMYLFQTDIDLAFNIIENPDWHGYTCEFFNREKKYLTTQTVGYYQEVTYEGPAIPTEEEDFDNKYVFKDWTRSTQYIHQDMQFLARYVTLEKRFYGDKMLNWDYLNISGIINEDHKRGSVLQYLGRVRRVAAIHGEPQLLGSEDIEVSLTEMSDYGSYWSQMCQDIVTNSIEYVSDPDYASKIYGDPRSIINNPSFALDFDSRYQYKSEMKAFLADEGDITLSRNSAYETLVRRISGFVYDDQRRAVTKENLRGYYRAAVVASFDVYASISLEKLDEEAYEVSHYNQFVFSPVDGSIKFQIQYSEDGSFGANFENKLKITDKGLYSAAETLEWGN